MSLTPRASDLPTRFVTGAYIAHAGLDKWHATAEVSAGIHRTAASAFPILRSLPPRRFVRLLAAGEVLTGGLLLAPIVPNRVAGAALTAFSGSLLTMYLRMPTMHKRRSFWPTGPGIGLSKDVWMFGVGLSLLIDGLSGRTSRA